MRTLVAMLALVAFYSPATARSLDSPLPPNFKLVRTQSLTIGQNGTSSDLFVPNCVFTIDYLVEPGKALRLTVLTREQMDEIEIGHKLRGRPLKNVVISGSGSESLRLERGNYNILFLPNGAQSAKLSYRASYQPGD